MDFEPAISHQEVWYAFAYEVYLHDYQTVPVARAQLSEHFGFCNTERPHEALGYRTPQEVYFGTRPALAQAPAATVLAWAGWRSSFLGPMAKPFFRSSPKEWLQGSKMDKLVTSGRLSIHLQKAPKLSKEWGRGQGDQ